MFSMFSNLKSNMDRFIEFQPEDNSFHWWI